MALKQYILLVAFVVLFRYLCGHETGSCVCGLAISKPCAVDSCYHVDNVCKDAEAPTCLLSPNEGPRLGIANDIVWERGGLGCENQPTLQSTRRASTTDLPLVLTPLAHNCLEYNLTVSWKSLNQTTIPAGATYELKFFEWNTMNNLLKTRRVCLPGEQASDGHPVRMAYSFEGLLIRGEKYYGAVELSVLAANGSVLITMTSFEFMIPQQYLEISDSSLFMVPQRYLDIIPVSSYRCIEQENTLRFLPVINLSHTLSQERDKYRVRLLWQKNPKVEKLKIPLTYFIKVYNNFSDTFSTAFHTNQTEISIYPLEPTREYFIKVQPFMPCSTTCGRGELQTILSTPASAPNVSHISSLSPSEIEVVWDEIASPDSNGIVLYYEVQYSAVNGSAPQYVNATNHSITLSGLRELTLYEVSVRAYTSIGAGPFSQIFSNWTHARPTTISTTSTTSNIPPTSNMSPTSTTSNIPPTSTTSNIHMIIVPVTLVTFVLITVLVLFSILSFVVRNSRYRSSMSKCFTRQDISLPPVQTNMGYVAEGIEIMVSKNGESSLSRSSSASFRLEDIAIGEFPTWRDSESTSSFPLSPVAGSNVLLVFSKRYPGREHLCHTLAETLSKCYNSSENKINIRFPGVDGGDFTRLSAPDYLETIIKQSGDLCFLCVVNKEFREEWNGTGQIQNSLVYSVSRYLTGQLNFCVDIHKKFLVLYEKNDDLDKFVPDSLKACVTCSVDDVQGIGRYIFREPEFK